MKIFDEYGHISSEALAVFCLADATERLSPKFWLILAHLAVCGGCRRAVKELDNDDDDNSKEFE